MNEGAGLGALAASTPYGALFSAGASALGSALSDPSGPSAAANASPFNNNTEFNFGGSKGGGVTAGPVSASATASQPAASNRTNGGLSPQSLSSGDLETFSVGGLSNQMIALIASGVLVLIVGLLFLFGRK